MTYFPPIDEVLAIHDRIIEASGGREGIFSFTLIHSAIERPKATFGGNDLYHSVYEKGAAMLHSLIQNHPFVDGNKRSAIAATARFFHLNGYELRLPIEETIQFTLKTQNKKTDFEEITYWLRKHAERKR